MIYISAVFLGLIIAVVGIIAPGMLNMTIAKLSIQENKKEALKFALGAVLIVFVQSFLGTFFAKFLDQNPVFSEGLKKIGTFIFIGLTIAFLLMGLRAKKQKKIDVTLKKTKNTFLYGITLSAFNMFAIPYYAFTTLTLASKNLFVYNQITIPLFALGAAFGTYFVFYLYASFFKKIEHKLTFIVNNINFLIAILTGIVAITSLFKMFFQS